MKTDRFTDASVQYHNKHITLCYRSGLSVFEETLYDGVPVSAGINTAGYPLNVLGNFPTRLSPEALDEPFAFNIELNGESVCRKMRYTDFHTEENDSRLHAVLTLDSDVMPIRVYEHTLLDGTAMFSRWLEIENLTAKPLSVSRLVLYGGGLTSVDPADVSWMSRPDLSSVFSVGSFEQDEWGNEGSFRWRPLENETIVSDHRFGAERFRHPLLFIKNKLSGDIYFSQIGFSAGCRYTVRHNASERKGSFLSICAEITGYKPLTVIRPGEKYTSPEVYMGAVHGSLDDAVNEMHAHIRKCVLNRPEADGSALFIGSGMGAEHDMSVETTKSYMKQLYEMGAEVFIIDAGWVCPPGKETEWGVNNGKNRPDKDRYPGDAFSELRDFCHETGMDFGLWCEIERLGDACGIKEKHPDWIAENLYGSRGGSVIDLTVPAAAAWAENELARIITEYKLDLLRVDYNVSGKEAFSFRDLGTGTQECLALRHYEKVYEIYGRLKNRFPDVIFENCAGGGGRTDLGMLRAFNHTWVSDNQKMPRSVMITNGMTMALPPERVDRLFAGMGCHTIGELKAHMRNTMLTHMSLNVIAPASARANSEAMEFIKHSTDIYKDFIRPMLSDSKIYHHTPTAADAEKRGAFITELASSDASQAAITVFSLPETALSCERTFDGGADIVIYPRGLRADTEYAVTLDNTGDYYVEDGIKLLRHGIKVRLSAALSSELVLIEEI